MNLASFFSQSIKFASFNYSLSRLACMHFLRPKRKTHLFSSFLRRGIIAPDLFFPAIKFQGGGIHFYRFSKSLFRFPSVFPTGPHRVGQHHQEVLPEQPRPLPHRRGPHAALRLAQPGRELRAVHTGKVRNECLASNNSSPVQFV